ncbi:MAG: TIGR01777 family oxidoreductase [Balneolaceae bacterium]
MEKIKRFLITGATGFIGSYLRNKLMRDGHFVTVLTRSPERYQEEEAKNQKFISWDRDLVPVMESCDVVINLAGESIFGKRWTDDVKERIYQSRIESTTQLSEAINRAEAPPELFISASAAGYYGGRGDDLLDETSEPGDDFLAKVCEDWEAAAMKVESPDVRILIPRIGIVLEEGGGMLKQMVLPFKLFAGGPVGHGEQYIPWIHMEDLCRGILFPVDNPDLEGAYNICSPNPVTMNEFATVMGEMMRRPSFFRVPEFALNLVLGEAAEPVMSSLRVKPAVLMKHGFKFRYTKIEEALADIL